MSTARRIVTTREGGDSVAPYDAFNLGLGVGDDPQVVTRNRRRLADAAGLPVDGIVWMRQVHGARVDVVDGPGDRDGADGLVTSTPGLGLAVLAADCVPLLVADQAAGVVGVAHAGRPGAAEGIALRLVEAMETIGAHREDMDVLVGPAICGRCYEVPADLQAQVETSLPGASCSTSTGTAGLDLRAGLVRQLRRAGITMIAVDERCTREDPELFSYRRDGVTGRQAGLTWLGG